MYHTFSSYVHSLATIYNFPQILSINFNSCDVKLKYNISKVCHSFSLLTHFLLMLQFLCVNINFLFYMHIIAWSGAKHKKRGGGGIRSGTKMADNNGKFYVTEWTRQRQESRQKRKENKMINWKFSSLDSFLLFALNLFNTLFYSLCVIFPSPRVIIMRYFYFFFFWIVRLTPRGRILKRKQRWEEGVANEICLIWNCKLVWGVD